MLAEKPPSPILVCSELMVDPKKPLSPHSCRSRNKIISLNVCYTSPMVLRPPLGMNWTLSSGPHSLLSGSGPLRALCATPDWQSQAPQGVPFWSCVLGSCPSLHSKNLILILFEDLLISGTGFFWFHGLTVWSCLC